MRLSPIGAGKMRGIDLSMRLLVRQLQIRAECLFSKR
jgi:hypothetical protein